MLDRLVLGKERSVAQGLVDVGSFQIWVALEDRLTCLTSCQKAQQSRHRKTKPTNTWLTAHNDGVDSDAIKFHATDASTMPGNPKRSLRAMRSDYFIIGMTNSAPSLAPDGQREVTVLVLV
jgi:hypothetical protein